MKSKIITVALLAIALYSCGGSKSSAPMAEARKVEVTPALAEGKTLYESNCVKCHKLYAPSDFSKEEWRPIVTQMQKKARLSDEQGNSIYNYIISGLK